MGVGDESEGAGGLEGLGRTAEFRAVMAVAGALRGEFGVGIDAHPGGEGIEAGVVNRAFRATVRAIFGGVGSPGDDLAHVITWALRQIALNRLTELGLEDDLARGLLGSEPVLRDAWLAYLTLAPATVVDDLLGGESPSPEMRPGDQAPQMR